MGDANPKPGPLDEQVRRRLLLAEPCRAMPGPLDHGIPPHPEIEPMAHPIPSNRPHRRSFRAGAMACAMALSLCGGAAEDSPKAAEAAAANPFEGLRAGEILQRTFATVPDDLYGMLRAPFDHPGGTALVTGGLLALVATDKPMTRAYQRLEPTGKPKGLWDTSVRGTGPDTYLVALIPTTYLGSLAAGSSRGQVASLLSAKALVYSILVSQITLKSLTGRRRPNDDLNSGKAATLPFTDDPWDWGHAHRPYFNPNSDGTAFPSFHATLWASVAQVVHEVYDIPWVLPYGVALLGFSVGQKHNHWFSDIVAGSLVGMGIGHVVVREFKGHGKVLKIGGLSGSLVPFIDPQGESGLALRLTW